MTDDLKHKSIITIQVFCQAMKLKSGILNFYEIFNEVLVASVVPDYFFSMILPTSEFLQ